jgi:NAD(P)-dependent dehydrogenase (short-subunit alcohol dehydrogenase family)
MVAVITGGGSGIGRAIASELWGEGATVCLVGRNRERLEKSLTIDGGGRDRVNIYPLDITRDEEVIDLAQNLLERHGRIDVLVHSAGAFVHGEWESFSSGDLDFLYKTNLRAPVLLTQALLPMLRASRGQIVFINSSAGRIARAKVGAYSATKHGLHAFADSLREEVNPEGIRVISVYPGRTATPMQELVCRLEGSEYRPERFLSPEDVAAAVMNTIGMARTAEVTDLYIRPMAKPN